MKQVEIFLYDQVVGLDVMGPLEVFTSANQIRELQHKPPAYQVTLSAETPGLVTLSSGIQLKAERSLFPPCDTDLTSDDNLVFPSAKDSQNPQTLQNDYFMLVGSVIAPDLVQNTELIRQLSAKARAARCQVSVCTGAFLLAATGLLNGKLCTTHWYYSERLAKMFPEVNVDADALYIQQDTVCSSAGVSAGIDLSLALVEQDYGVELAMDVARSLVLYMRRPGHQSQFSTPVSLRKKAGHHFNRLHDWLLDNLRAALSVEQMAEYCRMSPRNFARRFTRTTGVTPAKYLEQLRLSQARGLLESTQLSVEAVALDTGFGREERLRRVFLKNLGVTPSIYRQHFNG